MKKIAYSCILVMMIGVSRGAVNCPPSQSISPCFCSASSLNSNGISIYCDKQNLDDSKMSTILNAFTAPGISPVIEFQASGNELTVIPFLVSQCTTLVLIGLHNNKITSISLGAFNIKLAVPVIIGLSNNQITSIPVGMFAYSKPTSIGIDLSYNKITAVTYGAFNFESASKVGINLSNNRIASIPAGTLFNFPSAKSVTIFLYNNQITSFVSDNFQFPLATYLGISLAQNKISSLSPQSFAFPSSTPIQIDLSYNQISTISPGTFQTGNFSVILLNNNHINRFESDVFKSLLDNMFSGVLSTNKGDYLSIKEVPIDCSTYPCDMAWLIRDNRQLLSHVRDGVCSDGTAFSNLDPMGYSGCPVIC